MKGSKCRISESSLKRFSNLIAYLNSAYDAEKC
jgi:hypothetical protein